MVPCIPCIANPFKCYDIYSKAENLKSNIIAHHLNLIITRPFTAQMLASLVAMDMWVSEVDHIVFDFSIQNMISSVKAYHSSFAIH